VRSGHGGGHCAGPDPLMGSRAPPRSPKGSPQGGRPLGRHCCHVRLCRGEGQRGDLARRRPRRAGLSSPPTGAPYAHQRRPCGPGARPPPQWGLIFGLFVAPFLDSPSRDAIPRSETPNPRPIRSTPRPETPNPRPIRSTLLDGNWWRRRESKLAPVRAGRVVSPGNQGDLRRRRPGRFPRFPRLSTLVYLSRGPIWGPVSEPRVPRVSRVARQ
jgi:hypothetical protein